VGYGEPTFAAFYPNCHSVFGFYDPDHPTEADGRQYYVIGWYSDPEQDYLKMFRAGIANNKDPLIRTKADDKDFLLKVLEDDLKWTLALTKTQDFPEQMLCYAKLVLGKETNEQKQDATVRIAVGNTGTEALSSYLATTISSSAKNKIEDQLEALQLSAGLEHRQLDIGPKFFEARHEKGFTAIPGGSLWTIRPETKNTSAADVVDATLGSTLPDEMADLLNVANDRQQEYDRALQELESMRRQLFSDWYKYMLCAYRPEDIRDDYPDIDEVKSYIEASVDSLKKRIEQVGKLKDENGRFHASAHSFSSRSLAGELAAAINNLQASVDRHNDELKDTGSAYRLKQIPGPRYWRPTVSVLLIEGSIVKASERHGQDGRPCDGLLETQILLNADMNNLPDQDFRGFIRQRIDDIGRDSDENFAFSTWTAQSWNPFLLEWEVEVFPVENKSNLDPATGRYDKDFISDNYQLVENQVDLSVRSGEGSTAKAACVYSGRSILTPHAGIQLTERIEAYLNKEVLPQFYQAKSIPVRTAYLERHIGEVQTLYETTNASSLNTPQSKDEDPVYTAIRAWKALKVLSCLSQSLGGFNEALLMHKQIMQLGISDPLGFDEYQTFAESVSKAVEASIYSAPEPSNDFNPIRSGTMKILQLRLVDTFGQAKDLDVTNVITSEPMNDSDDDSHVRLAPRLMQPARINFRWLAAESDEQEMNDHPATTPICGWVLTNNLDNSLMIYDNRGKALGSLAMKDAKPTWEPAPGSRAAVNDITEIKDLHLRMMVASIQRCATLSSISGADFLSDFISAVDNALENIEPENFARHQDIALLMGRPLALVRASLNLELQSPPVVHQGWNEFRQDMQRETRDDNGFSQVQFPIRIGDYKQFNDGTVGYWKEKGDGYEGDVFYAPQSDAKAKTTDSNLKTHRTDSMTVFQSVESEPQILSLLLDPRGVVHTTSGILPAKAISIPPDQYAAALQAIEITFLSTPILTDAGKIRLPLPTEAGYQWTWLQQDGHGIWSEISSRGVVRKDAFAGFQGDADVIWNELIKQGWIEVIDPQEPSRASVTAKDKRKNQSLAENLKDKVVEIEDILDRLHIGPVNPDAKFSGPQEIREGWLKLSVDEGSAT
jgi:hypothetical protein